MVRCSKPCRELCKDSEYALSRRIKIMGFFSTHCAILIEALTSPSPVPCVFPQGSSGGRCCGHQPCRRIAGRAHTKAPRVHRCHGPSPNADSLACLAKHQLPFSLRREQRGKGEC